MTTLEEIKEHGLLAEFSFSEYESIKKGSGEVDQNHMEALIKEKFPEDRHERLLNANERYEVLEFADYESDLQAYLLRNRESGDYVLSFRGSTNMADVKADLKIGMGHNPQEKDGLDFLDHMMEKYAIKKENLSLTGQSLGGILAQSIGTMTKIRTFAFNPYGTEGLIKEEIDDAHREFADENVFTVSHTHDQLSNFLTTAMTSHVGKVVEINGGEEENPHMREGHSIQKLNRLIEKITEEYGLETLEDLEAYNASFKKNTLVNKVTSFVDAAYKQVKVQKEAAKEKEEAQEPQKAETSQESGVKKIITFFKESYDEVQETKEAKKEKKKNCIRHKQAFHEAP